MRLIFAVLIAGGLLAGCSKKAADANATPASNSTEKTPASPQMSAMVTEGLADISKKIEAKQYEAAIGGLVSLKDMPKTPKEEDAYNQRVRDTWVLLRERADKGDAAAMAHQQMLGRIMTGR